MSTPKQSSPITLPPAVSASRISGILGTKFVRFNGNSDTGGFRVCQAVDELDRFPVAVVEYHGMRKEMGPGRYSESKVFEAHRARLEEMREFLQKNGYTVVWGWEPNGEVNTTFLAVVTALMLAQREAEKKPAAALVAEVEPLAMDATGEVLSITIEQAEKAVQDITHAYNAGKDEAARRMEQALYRAVLVSTVCGSPDAVDLAGIALVTQKLFFAR